MPMSRSLAAGDSACHLAAMIQQLIAIKPNAIWPAPRHDSPYAGLESGLPKGTRRANVPGDSAENAPCVLQPWSVLDVHLAVPQVLRVLQGGHTMRSQTA
jgi:hypothetical protein